MNPQRVKSPKALVNRASPLASECQLRTVAKRMRRWKCWLPIRSQYYKNVTNVLRKKKDIDGPELGEYIACSAPLHLADGWNYLSRAFDAATRGDRDSAYHLAYYAELRAAIALLATEGVGIFDRRHIALNRQLEPTAYHNSTHQATWLVLSAWAEEKNKATRLLQAITIDSTTLSECLAVVGVVNPAQKIVAQKWLRAWSIDLQILATDQQRRNEVIYRPTRIQSQKLQPTDPQSENVDPLINFWSVLEPALGRASAVLDLSLLRQALQLVVKEGWCNYTCFDDAVRSA